LISWRMEAAPSSGLSALEERPGFTSSHGSHLWLVDKVEDGGCSVLWPFSIRGEA